MTTKYIVNDLGTLAEKATVSVTAGAGDTDKIPSLNAAGVLDKSILNGIQASAGAVDGGRTVVLGATGRIDSSMMPVGIGADTTAIIANEALVSGDLVNIYDNAGTANCRKADGSTIGKEAHGFVTAGYAAGVPATVFFEGTNDQCAGLTAGPQYLHAAIPGKTTNIAGIPVGAGKTLQRVGIATSATSFNFEASDPIKLA